MMTGVCGRAGSHRNKCSENNDTTDEVGQHVQAEEAMLIDRIREDEEDGIGFSDERGVKCLGWLNLCKISAGEDGLAV